MAIDIFNLISLCVVDEKPSLKRICYCENSMYTNEIFCFGKGPRRIPAKIVCIVPEALIHSSYTIQEFDLET